MMYRVECTKCETKTVPYLMPEGAVAVWNDEDGIMRAKKGCHLEDWKNQILPYPACGKMPEMVEHEDEYERCKFFVECQTDGCSRFSFDLWSNEWDAVERWNNFERGTQKFRKPKTKKEKA